MRVLCWANLEGSPVAVVSDYTRAEAAAALTAAVAAVRAKHRGDLEIYESIPNDHGFLSQPYYMVYPASKKTPIKEEFTRNIRHAHVRRSRMEFRA